LLHKHYNKSSNEEIKVSNRNCKVNESAVFFTFSLLDGYEKNQLLLLNLTFITNTKQ